MKEGEREMVWKSFGGRASLLSPCPPAWFSLADRLCPLSARTRLRKRTGRVFMLHVTQ